ncbi:MAG: heparinase II/III family protein [Chitinophagaceae bacterium]|nr:heparinase II/III family protein [Chitinophagaceae bacterium]
MSDWLYKDIEKNRQKLLLFGQSPDDLRVKSQLPEWAAYRKAIVEDAELLLHTPLPTGEDMWDIRNWIGRMIFHTVAYWISGRHEFSACARQITLDFVKRGEWRDIRHRWTTFDIAMGETCFGLGLLYDWLYDEFSEEERRLLRSTIVEKLLVYFIYESDRPGEKIHMAGRANWTGVMNGGAVTAALALWDEHPICSEVVNRARSNVKPFLASWVDGGCEEGASYWGYGLTYLWYMYTQLEEKLGITDGVWEYKGLEDTGLYPILFFPNKTLVGFGDAWPGGSLSPILFLMERTGKHRKYSPFLQASLLEAEDGMLQSRRFAPGREWNAGLVYTFIWAIDNRPAEQQVLASLPLAKCWPHSAYVAAADSWPSPSRYLAVHGGVLETLHCHYDHGHFQYMVNNEFIFCDLGPLLYTTPDYFDELLRRTIYESGSAGHNTLTVDGESQIYHCFAPIINFETSHEQSSWTVVLENSYPANDIKLRRHFIWIHATGEFAYTDVLESETPHQITAHLHTLQDMTGDKDFLYIVGKASSANLTFAADASWALTVEENTYLSPLNPEAPHSRVQKGRREMRAVQTFEPLKSMISTAAIVPGGPEESSAGPKAKINIASGTVCIYFPLSGIHAELHL